MHKPISPKNEMQFAMWCRDITPSALQISLRNAAKPDVLSFALGLPAPNLIPAQQLSQAAAALSSHGPRCFQYSQASPHLKAHIVRIMALRGIACRESQIFITAGAQQGLHLLSLLLLDRGSSVIAEQFLYPGFRQAIAPFDVEIMEISSDLATGMDVEQVAWHLDRSTRPAFIYSIADGHNPLGVSLSDEKRTYLIDAAQKQGIPIVEEDPYGLLDYSSEKRRPLVGYGYQNVCYVGSFSKILAPTLRLGWLVVAEPYIERLSIIKESVDINMASLSQHIVAELLSTFDLHSHLHGLRRAYALRLNAMLEALTLHFPPESLWTVPTHGFFVFVQLPEAIDTADLLEKSLSGEKIAFVPGSAFARNMSGSGTHCMRLNFSVAEVEQISDGVRRLASVIRNS